MGGDVVDLEGKRQARRAHEAELLEESVDQEQNQQFDRLLELADWTWSWRDKESLEDLYTQLLKCAEIVTAEWGEQVLFAR